MPAAIRIDIHLGSVGQLAQDLEGSAEAYLDSLAKKLSDSVRACILENTNQLQDELEGDLTPPDAVRVHIQSGLGDAWPPKSDDPDPTPIGEGIDEYLAQLRRGQVSNGLMAQDAYSDGMRFISVRCDFG
jgi:hypothetical protein